MRKIVSTITGKLQRVLEENKPKLVEVKSQGWASYEFGSLRYDTYCPEAIVAEAMNRTGLGVREALIGTDEESSISCELLFAVTCLLGEVSGERCFKGVPNKELILRGDESGNLTLTAHYYKAIINLGLDKEILTGSLENDFNEVNEEWCVVLLKADRFHHVNVADDPVYPSRDVYMMGGDGASTSKLFKIATFKGEE